MSAENSASPLPYAASARRAASLASAAGPSASAQLRGNPNVPSFPRSSSSRSASLDSSASSRAFISLSEKSAEIIIFMNTGTPCEL